jgi:hypothetical protein
MGRRGPKPTGQASHGSRGGFVMHQQDKTPACEPCRQANIRWTRAYKKRGKCEAGLGWPLLPASEASRG